MIDTVSGTSAPTSIHPIILAAAGVIFAAATALGGYLAYLSVFTGFMPYDDEGYVLVTLRSFITGQPLYDRVFTQYGPFYFEFFGLLGALGVPFDHDSGRVEHW